MTKWIIRSKRKITGGLIVKNSKKKKHQRARDFLPARVGENKIKITRAKGGNEKRTALMINIANVSDKGKIKKSKIISVAENPADAQFTRRNIITKGAIVQTEDGFAKITNRPGQEGFVNAIAVERQIEMGKAKKK